MLYLGGIRRDPDSENYPYMKEPYRLESLVYSGFCVTVDHGLHAHDAILDWASRGESEPLDLEFRNLSRVMPKVLV